VFFIVLDLRLTKVWGLGGAPFSILSPFSTIPSVSRDNKNKETEAADFRFSILIFGEQVNDLSP
jgi:hypothetical protein